MGPMEGPHSPIFVPVANERRMSNAQGVHPPPLPMSALRTRPDVVPSPLIGRALRGVPSEPSPPLLRRRVDNRLTRTHPRVC